MPHRPDLVSEIRLSRVPQIHGLDPQIDDVVDADHAGVGAPSSMIRKDLHNSFGFCARVRAILANMPVASQSLTRSRDNCMTFSHST